MRILIVGLPGAGKGTQGKRLADLYDIPHISSGSMFRDAERAGVPEALEAAEHIKKGNLVPDCLANQLVKHRLDMEDCRKGYILEGYPRNVAQAKELQKTLAELGQSIDAVIELRISCEEAISRLVNRRTCSVCEATYQEHQYSNAESCAVCGGKLIKRSDDNLETAKARLQTYFEQTHPLVEYYQEQGLLLSFNGERDIEVVFNEIVERINECLGKNKDERAY
jgi:adenylate kinase